MNSDFIDPSPGEIYLLEHDQVPNDSVKDWHNDSGERKAPDSKPKIWRTYYTSREFKKAKIRLFNDEYSSILIHYIKNI